MAAEKLKCESELLLFLWEMEMLAVVFGREFKTLFRWTCFVSAGRSHGNACGPVRTVMSSSIVFALHALATFDMGEENHGSWLAGLISLYVLQNTYSAAMQVRVRGLQIVWQDPRLGSE